MSDSVEIPKCEMVRVNFYVPHAAHKSLVFLANQDGRSLSEVIRESIRDYLNKHENKLFFEDAFKTPVHGGGLLQK
jgi:predicted DNA-binding protein